MASSTKRPKERTDSSTLPPQPAKRVRKPTAKAPPPPPPKKVTPKAKAAVPKKDSAINTPTEPVIDLEEASSPSLQLSPEPERPPHNVHFQCTVLLDGKVVKTFGRSCDINSILHTGFYQFKKLADSLIESYMANRGGKVHFYKGPWRASWGAIKDPFTQDIDTWRDWDDLEELLRLRAATSGGVRNAARVDIKAHFKTRGNADSSPPPQPENTPRQEITTPQIKAKSKKSKPYTIRQGRDQASSPDPFLEPSASTGRKSPTNQQLERVTQSTTSPNKLEDIQSKLFEMNWCSDEQCSNYQKRACCIRAGELNEHYELTPKLLQLWGGCINKEAWQSFRAPPPEVWVAIFRSKQVPMKAKGQRKAERKASTPQPVSTTPPLQQSAPQIPSTVQILYPPYQQPIQQFPYLAGQSYGGYTTPPSYPPSGPSLLPQTRTPFDLTVDSTPTPITASEAPLPLSSPIKTRDPDQVIEDFGKWLKDYIPSNRYSIVQTGLFRIIDQGFTLEDIRDIPAKDFIDIGVKAAALFLMKPYLRQFAREYKSKQARQAARSLAQLATSQSQEESQFQESQLEEEEKEEAQWAEPYSFPELIDFTKDIDNYTDNDTQSEDI
jgi:hypothetical protein